MDVSVEKECSALGGLFQQIITDMKVRETVIFAYILIQLFCLHYLTILKC